MLFKLNIKFLMALALLIGVSQALAGQPGEPRSAYTGAQHNEEHMQTQADLTGTGFVDFFGYSKCIQLENANTRVVLCPQAGGRILEYAWKGQNALYLDPDQKGWVYEPGKPMVNPCAGRFDIGPERIIASHPDLWQGKWSGEMVGPRHARLKSPRDAATGVQLIREFILDASTTHLICKQTITNITDKPVACCHWSRTLAGGGGICLIPLTPGSRFPKSYIMYGPGPVMNYQPEDPNIRIRDGFLEILGTPLQPKLGLDSYGGWFCYLTKNDLMFIKRFPVFPDRVYGEMAGLTISIWYFENLMCELEPIGPYEQIAPRHSADYTEEWWLTPYRFPGKGGPENLDEIRRVVEQQTQHY